MGGGAKANVIRASNRSGKQANKLEGKPEKKPYARITGEIEGGLF